MVGRFSPSHSSSIVKLAFDVIPQDTTRPEFRQSATLAADHKHCFRAKFFQQYRLFFRYHEPSQLIVFAWVNDETSKMLEGGHPPDEWNQLLAEAQAEGQQPIHGAITPPPPDPAPTPGKGKRG
jgi:toxin YhaV